MPMKVIILALALCLMCGLGYAEEKSKDYYKGYADGWRDAQESVKRAILPGLEKIAELSKPNK